MLRAIFDTNVFVGAGFNRNGASARLLAAARAGDVLMVWAEETRDETRHILEKNPPLSWQAARDLFMPEGKWIAPLDLAAVNFVTDPDDRKYAALSRAAGVPVVSSDDDLLRHAKRLDVLKPGAFLAERAGG